MRHLPKVGARSATISRLLIREIDLSGPADAGSLPDTFCRWKRAVTGRDASGISGTARDERRGRRDEPHRVAHAAAGLRETAVGAVAVPPG